MTETNKVKKTLPVILSRLAGFRICFQLIPFEHSFIIYHG